MKTRIENETVKPAGITYPALFNGRQGDVWFQYNERGDGVCIAEDSDGAFDVGMYDCERLQFNVDYTYIPGPLTITFNSDKE